MDGALNHTLSVFLGFFAIMNPIANTPIFLGLTADDDPAITRQIARNALLLTFVLIVIFCVLGKAIFELFGITLPAFRITGGVLVSLIGYHMLQGAQSSMHHVSDEDAASSRAAQLSVAISPLAVPLLAGPGTIATAMNFSAVAENHELFITVAAFAVLCLITFYCFVYGQGMVRFLGQNGLNVITRLMGLILAVIGVQMLIEGIKGAFAIGS